MKVIGSGGEDKNPKKFSRREHKKISKLETLIGLMQVELEQGNFEKLPELLKEFDKQLDLELKGGFLKEDTLKKYKRALEFLKTLAEQKKEELNREFLHLKKLKSYGEY
jgi:hypothetical protein